MSKECDKLVQIDWAQSVVNLFCKNAMKQHISNLMKIYQVINFILTIPYVEERKDIARPALDGRAQILTTI